MRRRGGRSTPRRSGKTRPGITGSRLEDRSNNLKV